MQILLVDDHPLYLSGLGDLVESAHPDWQVLRATSLRAARRVLVNRLQLGLACIDLRLPDGDGAELVATVRAQQGQVPVLIVTAGDDAAGIQRALAAGAAGCILKSAPSATILQALEHVLRGEPCPLPTMSAAPRLPPLTSRQRQVLERVIAGATNPEIARELGISERTVKGHVAVLFDRFQAGNRAACVAAALARGFQPTVPPA
ncbi:MAG: response regulator transcription factor [Gammaproteobacteria bacterium]